MPLSSYALRSLPAIMPLIAVCSALIGLALPLGTFPTVGNLMLVLYATFLCGILPICVFAGAIFLIADILQHSFWRFLLLAAAAITCVTGFVGFFYGRGLDF